MQFFLFFENKFWKILQIILKGMWQNISMEKKKGFKVEKDNENDICWILNDEKYRWLNVR